MAGIPQSPAQQSALTGVVLTKVDGDARGGAALSIRHHRQARLNSSVGEKTDARWSRSPRSYRLAYSRHGRRAENALIEDIESKVDRAQAEADQTEEGDGFDLNDFTERTNR